MNLEGSMLSEISQSLKTKTVCFDLNEFPSVVTFIEAENTTVVTRGWG